MKQNLWRGQRTSLLLTCVLVTSAFMLIANNVQVPARRILYTGEYKPTEQLWFRWFEINEYYRYNYINESGILILRNNTYDRLETANGRTLYENGHRQIGKKSLNVLIRERFRIPTNFRDKESSLDQIYLKPLRGNILHRKHTKLRTKDTPIDYLNSIFKNHTDLSNFVNNKVLWTKSVEKLILEGPSWAEVEKSLAGIKSSRVSSLYKASWNRCGRPKNGFAIMENGARFCARYREKNNDLVFGEMLSFYLSRLLGMDNVPLVTLSQIEVTGRSQWSQTNFSKLGWKPGSLVALIRWRDGLNSARSSVKMPSLLLDSLVDNSTTFATSVPWDRMKVYDVIELFQWGEMIIFDYITGNYDRVASMQDGARTEKRPDVLRENIRNLKKDETNKLWLIDNESGLFDAYDSLYRDHLIGPLFQEFHRRMLRTLCIFKRSTVINIRNLLQHQSPHLHLVAFAQKYEPLFNITNIRSFHTFAEHFRQRLREVSEWVNHCLKHTPDIY